MAVQSSPVPKSKSVSKKRAEAQAEGNNGGTQPPAKRTKSPGVRLVHGRIYDSENGKTCHQCRQKTMDFVASCKNMKVMKPCTLSICHKCLLNRYGEKAEDVALLSDWSCPKCRGICNCSFCMKKKGHKPTGMLIYAAKATGFKSASEFIQEKGIENLELYKALERTVVSPKKPTASNGECTVVSPRKVLKENLSETSGDVNLNPSNLKKVSKKVKRERLVEISNAKNGDDSGVGNSPKRLKSSKKDSKKEVKTEGNDATVPVEKHKSKKMVEVEGSAPLKKKKSKKIVEDGAVAPLEKKKSKKNVVGETAPGLAVPDSKENKKDTGKCQEAVAKKESKGDKKQAKIAASLKTQVICKCDLSVELIIPEIILPLPKGSALVTVWGIDLLPEEVGHALQFLEFIAAFEKVLDFKKAQGASVLRELKRGTMGRRGQYSSAVRVHVLLLSLIQEDIGEEFSSLSKKNSWIQALEKCITESECVSKELSLTALGGGIDGYDSLDFSRKIRVLNFLCDEALCTGKLRDWIEAEHAKVVEKDKESKEMVLAAKSKAKLLKQKLQDDIAKAIIEKNGAPLTISEHEDIILQIKTDTAEAQAEILKAEGSVSKRKRLCGAVRTQPEFLDAEGRIFWKLKCCGGEHDMLLQDLGTWDVNAKSEKWSIYGSEQKEEIEKYIHSIRAKRASFQKFAPSLAC